MSGLSNPPQSDQSGWLEPILDKFSLSEGSRKDYGQVIAAILSHEAGVARAARIDELKRLTDEQENSQDWERANPGFSAEMVQAVKIHDRIAELSAAPQGDKEQS